jgi:two-component system, response regulator YesN
MRLIRSNSNRKLYVKIFVALTLSIIITMLILSTVLYVSFERTVSNEIYLANMGSLEQVSSEIYNMSNIASTISDQIYHDISISKLLYYANPDVYDLNLAMRQLNNYRVSIPFMDSICVFNSLTNEFYTEPAGIMSVKNENKDPKNGKEGYYDQQVIEMIDNFKKYKPYIPIPRKFTYKDDAGTAKNLYTFLVYDVQSGDHLNSAVVVNISDAWINNIINHNTDTKRMNTFIIDDKGVLVSDSEVFPMMSDYSDRQYIKEILNQNSSGYIVDMVNGTKSLVVYTKPDSFGWRYVRVIQWNTIFNKVEQIRTITVLICLSIIIPGILISFIISGRLYNPIRKIITNMEHLEEERRKGAKVLKQELIRNVILGREPGNKNSLMKLFDESEVSLSFTDGICMLLIKIDEFSSFVQNHDHKDQNLFKFAIMNITSEVLSVLYKTEAVDMGKDSMVVVLGLSDLQNFDPEKTLPSLVKKIQSAVAEYFKLSVSFTVSMSDDNIRNLNLLFNEVTRASLHRLFYGRGSIIYAFNISKYNLMEYTYPTQKEKQMVEAVMFGKTDEAKKMYNEIIYEVSTYPFEVYERTISHLLFTLNDAVNIIKNNNSIADNSISCIPFTILTDAEVIEEINVNFYKLFDNIRDRLEERKNTKYTNIIAGINEYIQSEYSNPMLSVDSIAMAFGVSTAHACRLYKQHTLHTILDEIVEIRMRKARELLVNTEYSIGEISGRVGFSGSSYFFKAFKAANGVTPSEYRKNLK